LGNRKKRSGKGQTVRPVVRGEGNWWKILIPKRKTKGGPVRKKYLQSGNPPCGMFPRGWYEQKKGKTGEQIKSTKTWQPCFPKRKGEVKTTPQWEGGK